jgi:DNA-binding NarL/FixJ family response regulator
MTILVLDDQALTADALASRIKLEIADEVEVLYRVADLTKEFIQSRRFDVAVIDLSFRDETLNGIDALFAFHRHSPSTRLVVHTVGDTHVERMLRDAWEVLPIAAAVAKGPSAASVTKVIRQVRAEGYAAMDPVLQPLLPAERRSRPPETFARLVPHLGHAKMWRALHDEPDGAMYADLAIAASVKVNAMKNYRADVVVELTAHHLSQPTTRDMQEFAKRCRPFLRPYLLAHGIRVIGID